MFLSFSLLPRFPSRQEAHSGCGPQSCCPLPPQREGGSQCLYVSYAAARGVKLKYTTGKMYNLHVVSGQHGYLFKDIPPDVRQKTCYMDTSDHCLRLEKKKAKCNTVHDLIL